MKSTRDERSLKGKVLQKNIKIAHNIRHKKTPKVLVINYTPSDMNFILGHNSSKFSSLSSKIYFTSITLLCIFRGPIYWCWLCGLITKTCCINQKAKDYNTKKFCGTLLWGSSSYTGESNAQSSLHSGPWISLDT